MHFEVIDATSTHDCDVLAEVWQKLLTAGVSREKIYQTHAYFKHIIETHPKKSAYSLLVIRGIGKTIVGILPVRECRHELRFRIGHICLFKYGFAVVQVLGSIPLLSADEPQLLEFSFKYLLQRYRTSRALVMQAVPGDVLERYEHLTGLAYRALHGWRECHVLVLPDTLEHYLQKFSAKKRYNLSRQLRLLAEQVGHVELIRITEATHIPGFVHQLQSMPAARKHLKPDFEDHLSSLAKLGLVLCYLLKAGNEVVAAVVGKRSAEVWHVHNIYYNEKYAHLSVGTSILHLAQQDVIKDLPVRRVDFGYGTPSQESRSHHFREKRAQVMLYDKTSSLNVILKIWALFDMADQQLRKRLKNMRSRTRPFPE
jgi:hypothetical protein